MKSINGRSLVFSAVFFLIISVLPVAMIKLIGFLFTDEVASVLLQLTDSFTVPPFAVTLLLAAIFYLFNAKKEARKWQKAVFYPVFCLISFAVSLLLTTVNGVPVFVVLKAALEVFI